MGILVGRYPYSASIDESILGSNIVSMSSHVRSLFFELYGILSNHPPIIVAVAVFSFGTGNIGIIPICCSKSCLVREGKDVGNHEPPNMTAKFLLANSFSKFAVIGLTPTSTSFLRNSNALTPWELL